MLIHYSWFYLTFWCGSIAVDLFLQGVHFKSQLGHQVSCLNPGISKEGALGICNGNR